MIRYVRVQDGQALPDVTDLKPFKAVLAIEDAVSPEWRNQVCDWLVESGCLYAMTWGEDCEVWHDSVDDARDTVSSVENIPDDAVVMTTWHDDEPLEDVFWFSKFAAIHGDVDLENVLILHIGAEDKRTEFEMMFERLDERTE